MTGWLEAPRLKPRGVASARHVGDRHRRVRRRETERHSIRAGSGYVVSATCSCPVFFAPHPSCVARSAAASFPYPGWDSISEHQYTGLLDATRWARLKYQFYGSSIDDEATCAPTTSSTTWMPARAGVVPWLRWDTDGKLDDDHAVPSQTWRGALSASTTENKVSGRVVFRPQHGRRRGRHFGPEYDRLDVRPMRDPSPRFLSAAAWPRDRRYTSRAEPNGWTGTAYGTWRCAALRDHGVIPR
jgi:hypothetical protein